VIRLSGRYRSALIIGGQGIRARKLRTFLSMISLFLGVLAVVAVEAGSTVANRAMLADVELTSGKDGTLQAYLPGDPKANTVALDVLAGKKNAVGMLTGMATIGEPGLASVNPGGAPLDQPGGYGPPMTCDEFGNCTEVSDAPQTQGEAIDVQLNALTGDVRQFRPFPLDSGRWLDFDASPSLSPGIVVNREAAKAFAQHRVPAEMHVEGAERNMTPRILGVVHDAGYGPAIYLRADELLNWMPVTGGSSSYGPPSVSVLAAPDATDVLDMLDSRLAAAGFRDAVQVQPVDVTERVGDQLALLRWIFLGMAALVLLIGVAGILNVGLATVGERVEEFALRRAVGTPRFLLAGIVLAETLITGLFTAAAAIGFGVLALNVGTKVVDLGPEFSDVTFPWQAGVAGVIAGLAAGLLGGLIPAVRAARIPIATVMRA
jgi:ABC-type antimicrobial peptide transport system permease subunit